MNQQYPGRGIFKAATQQTGQAPTKGNGIQEMGEAKIFRQKNLDRISSPEQLNDYITVTSPGIWLLLISIILVLSGALVWGIFGKLDTRIRVPAIVQDGVCTLYVEAANVKKVDLNEIVEIGSDYTGHIASLANEGEKAGEVLGSLALGEAGYDREDVVYGIISEISAPDGVYMAEIVVDRVSPVSFLTNEQ